MTKNQEKLLVFISNYRIKNNDYPTLKEMVEGIGVYDNRSVLGIIDNVIKQGYLGKSDRKYRTVFLTEKSLKLLKIRLLPISHEEIIFKELKFPETGMSLNKNSVSLPTLTSDIIYSDKKIEDNGTSLDIKNIIKSAVTSALTNYATGTFLEEKNEEKIVDKITALLFTLLNKNNFSEKLSWSLILIIFSSFCFLYFGKDFNSIAYSIMFTFTIFIIFKLSK